MNATTGNVNRYTRAPRGGFGKLIRCPCGWDTRVYHFRWSAMKCSACRNEIVKNDFLIVANNGIDNENNGL